MKLIKSLWQVFWLFFYYAFARHLPDSYHFQPLGYISQKVRGLACKYIFKFMGQNVNIDRGVKFGSGFGIEIGDNSGIGMNCQMPTNVKIGCEVMIGPDVLIIGQNHNYENLEMPMRLQGAKESEPVHIKDDSWIGARSIILPGVTIGKGSIIGAGAVVAKDIPAYSICVSNPAHIIKSRAGADNDKTKMSV